MQQEHKTLFNSILKVRFKDQSDIQEFSSRFIGQIEEAFVNATPENLNFEQRIAYYVDYLSVRGQAITFFEVCWEYREGFRGDENAGKLKELLNHYYEKAANGNFCFKLELFEPCLLRYEKLPFIGRSNIEKYVYKQINDYENKCLIISGKPKTGRSYIGYYLNELAKITEAFEFVKIDLKKISKNGLESVQMFHIAQELTRSILHEIPFEFTSPNNFKYEEFIPLLKNFLVKKRKEDNKKYLFFFDQFDVMYSQDVKEFLKRFVEDALFGPLSDQYFVVLAGFEDINHWEWETLEIVGDVELSDFTKEDIFQFLKRLCKHLDKKYELVWTYEDLINNLKQKRFLSDKYYNTQHASDKSNVMPIGRDVTSWIKELKMKIEES